MFDAVQSALRATVVESEELNRLARLQALARLQTGLGQAKAGVSIDKIAGLEEAMSVVSKPSEQFYGRFDEYARDQDAASDVLRQLELHGETSIDVAELTLRSLKGAAEQLDEQYQQDVRALDETLEKWRESIDIQRGTYVGVEAMGAAISSLDAKLQAAQAAQLAQAQTAQAAQMQMSQAQFEQAQRAQIEAAAARQAESERIAKAQRDAQAARDLAEAQAARAAKDAAAAQAANPLAQYSSAQVVGAVDYVQARAADGDLLGIYNGAKSVGMSADQVASALTLAGYPVGADEVNAWVAANKLDALPTRKFADGGAFIGGSIVRAPTFFDMAVMGEAGAEAIMPLANIGGKLGVKAMGGGMSEDVVNAILGLYGYLQSIAAATGSTALHTFNTKKATEDMVDRGVKVLPALNQPIKVEVLA